MEVAFDMKRKFGCVLRQRRMRPQKSPNEVYYGPYPLVRIRPAVYILHIFVGRFVDVVTNGFAVPIR